MKSGIFLIRDSVGETVWGSEKPQLNIMILKNLTKNQSAVYKINILRLIKYSSLNYMLHSDACIKSANICGIIFLHKYNLNFY